LSDDLSFAKQKGLSKIGPDSHQRLFHQFKNERETALGIPRFMKGFCNTETHSNWCN
jgi:hypothetical protein